MGGLAAASQPLRAFAPSRETRNPDFSDPAKRNPARSTTGPGRHRRYRLARIVAEQAVDAGRQIGVDLARQVAMARGVDARLVAERQEIIFSAKGPGMGLQVGRAHG